MEPWLLFFDIDGTFAGQRYKPGSGQYHKSFEKAQAAGHKIFFVHRPVQSIYTKAGGRDLF